MALVKEHPLVDEHHNYATTMATLHDDKTQTTTAAQLSQGSRCSTYQLI